MITADSLYHSPVERKSSISNEEEYLQKELSLSAMLVCLPVDFESDEQNENEGETENEILEDAMEEGGMQYVAGYIARKFPHYELGTAATKGDGTWIGAISARDGKLIQPKTEFLEKVKIMEKNVSLSSWGQKSKTWKGSYRDINGVHKKLS